MSDYTCDECKYDGPGRMADIPELEESVWHCPECGGEQRLPWPDIEP